MGHLVDQQSDLALLQKWFTSALREETYEQFVQKLR
jgi:hypothetical protein